MEPREQLGVHLSPAVGDSARTKAVITDAALLQWLQDWVSDAGRSLEQHRDGHGLTAAGPTSAAPDSDDQADTLSSLLTAQIAASASASVPPASRSSTGTDGQRRHQHAEFNARILEGSFRGLRHGTAITSPKPIPNRYPDALDAFLLRVSSLFEAGSTSVSSRNLLVSYGIDSTPEETGASASSASASSSTSPPHRHPTLPQLLAHCALRRAQIDLFNKSNSLTSVHRGSGSADGNASGSDDAIATAWMDLLTSARRVEARLVRFERGLDPDRDNDIDNDELDHVVPAVGNKDAAESALGGERDIDAELDLELDFGDGLRQSASASSPEPRKLNRSGRGGTKAQKHGHPATTAAVVANAASFASLVQQPASAPRGCLSLLDLGKSAGAATMRLVTTDARLPSSATDAAQPSASAPAAIGAGRGASAASADPVMDQLKALRQRNAKFAAKPPSGARIAIVGGGARAADDDGRTGGGAASSSAAQLPKGCAHVWEILLPPSDNMSLRRARIGSTAAAGAGSTIVKLPPGRQLLHWIPATRLRQVLHQRCVSMDNLVRDSDAVGLCRAAAFALRSPVLQDVQQQPQPTSLVPFHLSAFGVSEKIENEVILIDQLLVSLGLERVTSIAELAQLLHSEQRDNSASASAQPAMRSGFLNERDLQNFVSAATARVIVIIDVLESARKLRSMASSDSTVLDRYGILPHLDLLYRHDGAGLLEAHFGSLCLLLAYCALSMSSPSATTRGATSTIARSMLAGASQKLLLHSIASGINSQFGLQKLGGGAAPASPLNGEHADTIGDDASERSDDEDAHRPLHRLRRQAAVPAASSAASEHSASRDAQPLTLVQPSLSAVVCALGDIAVQCSHAGVAFHIIQLISSLPGVPVAASNACERLAAACVFTLYPVPALPHQVPQPPWLLHENGPLSRVAPADVLDQFRFMARSIAYNPSSSGRTHFEDSIALLTHVATCAAEMFAARALPWSTATEFHCATSQNGYHHLLQLQQATKSSVSSSPAQLRASNSNSTAAGSDDENDGDGDDAAESDREGDSEDSDPPSYTRGTGLATLSPPGRGRGRGRGGRGAGGNRKRLRYGHLSDTDEDVGDDDDWRGDAGTGRSKRGRGRGRGGKGASAAQGRVRGRGRGGSLSVKPPAVTMALSVAGTEEVAGGDELVALVDPFQDCSDEQLAHIRDLGFSTSQHRPAASSSSSSAPTPLADEGPLSHYVMRTLTPLNVFHVAAVTLELSVRLLDASFTSHSRPSNSTNADPRAFGSLLPVLGVSCAALVSPHASSSSSSASPDADDDYVPLRSLLALVRMLVQLCASIACTRASKGQKVGRGSRKADGSQQPYASATDIDAFITFLVDELVPVLNDVAHSLLSDLEVDPIPSACPDARVTAIRSVLHLASEIDTICDCIQAAATIDEVIHRTAARQCNRLKRSNSRLITWMLDSAGQLELNLLGTAVTASASAAAGDVSSSASATVGAMDTPYLPLPASISSGGRKKHAQSPGGKLLLQLSLGSTLEERSSAAGGNAATSDARSTSHQNGLLRSPYSRTLLWRRLLLVDRAPIFAYPSVWREGIDAEDDAGGNEIEGADEHVAADGGESGRHMGNFEGDGVNDGDDADAVQERASGSSASVEVPASCNRARKRDFVIEDDDDIDDGSQAAQSASIQSREVQHNQGVAVPIVAGQSSLASIMDSRTQSQPGDVAPSIVHDAAVASGAVDANSSAAAASDSFAAAASATQPLAALVHIQAMPPAQVHPGQLALQAQSQPLPHPLGPGQQPMMMAVHHANLQQMHPQLQHWAGMGLPSMVAMTPAQAYQLQLQSAMLPSQAPAAAASASYPSYPYAAYQQLQAQLQLQMQMMAMHQQQAVASGTAVAAAASHAPPGSRGHNGDRKGSDSDGSRSLSSSSSRRSKKRKSSKKPKHSSSGKKASKSHRSTKGSSKKHQSRKDRSRSRSDSRSSAASDHAASSANSASASASGAGAGASGGDEGGRRRSRHRRKRREEEEEIDYEDDADSGWGGTTSASDWGSQAEEDEDA